MASRLMHATCMIALIMGSVAPLTAQTPAPTGEQAAQAAPPSPETAGDEDIAIPAELLTAVPDPATVAMPKLAFTPTPEIVATYDKYFYFHRGDTSFTEALADIRECDAFARGLSSGMGYTTPYTGYGGAAGAVGSAIGSALVFAIFGSAEKRKLRRANLRRCMHYKGYQRFGLERELWQAFNFEEGFSGTGEAERQAKLAQQAKVASAPGIDGKDLGL